MPYSRRAKYIHERHFDPDLCDPRSFRVVHIKPGVQGTVCCPRGHWSRGYCEVGTRLQKIMKSKRAIRRGYVKPYRTTRQYRYKSWD